MFNYINMCIYIYIYIYVLRERYSDYKSNVNHSICLDPKVQTVLSIRFDPKCPKVLPREFYSAAEGDRLPAARGLPLAEAGVRLPLSALTVYVRRAWFVPNCLCRKPQQA